MAQSSSALEVSNLDDAQIKKGTIHFAGRSVLGLPPHHAARDGIVLVPERRKIFETLTVADNLHIARGRSTAADERETRTQRLLEVFPEHDMQLVRDLADRVFVLHYGRKLATGAPTEVLADPRVVQAYVGAG